MEAGSRLGLLALRLAGVWAGQELGSGQAREDPETHLLIRWRPKLAPADQRATLPQMGPEDASISLFQDSAATCIMAHPSVAQDMAASQPQVSPPGGVSTSLGCSPFAGQAAA